MNPPDPGRRSSRVTMMDVARRSGVSQPTVSVVLNKSPQARVGPETRQRILDAARELGYRPNRTAQDLRLSVSSTIGIVTDGIASAPYAGKTVLGIQAAVRDHGYVTLLADSGGDPKLEEQAVTEFLDRGITDILYAPSHVIWADPTPLLREVNRVVFVNCWPPEELTGPVVIADEYRGGRAAAEVAFRAGHRRVAFLGGTPGEWATIERQRGFVDAARDAGIGGRLLIREGTYRVDSGYALTLELFRRRQPPTALVCGNDWMALGALIALSELSLRVPQDVSLVGYDDLPDLADILHPALTTVRLPHFELGRRAGELIIDSAGGPADPIYIDCPLIERDSVGPPAR